MKRFAYSAMVALLTLGTLTTSTDAFAQSKKEQRKMAKQEQIRAWQQLQQELMPNPITVSFDSEPQGAKVVLDGRVVGVTPVTVRIPIKKYPTIVEGQGYMWYNPKTIVKELTIPVKFLKEGYQTGDLEITPETRQEFRNDIGYLSHFTWPTGLFHVFERDPYASAAAASNDAPTAHYGNDTSIPQGEAYQVVNRDTPGRTALEQTIIRWMIDSEPRGARVFWRVVSNCPAQVKNTNESYLGTTPYEDTRSFAIQGLTYENSRDVQIEIKITRAGYIDQVKRFNVRQAIDQMEISTFFDLVKREE